MKNEVMRVMLSGWVQAPIRKDPEVGTVVPTLWRVSQEGHSELKASLDYLPRSFLKTTTTRACPLLLFSM